MGQTSVNLDSAASFQELPGHVNLKFSRKMDKHGLEFTVVCASCFSGARRCQQRTGVADVKPDRKSEEGHLTSTAPGMPCCPVLLRMEAPMQYSARQTEARS